LADHDDAAHDDGVERAAHRVDGGLVGGLLLAPADPAGRGQGGGLRDAHELEREVAVGHLASRWRRLRRLAHASILSAYMRSGASTPTRPRLSAITVRAA